MKDIYQGMLPQSSVLLPVLVMDWWFQMLPAGLTATCEVAKREENKTKNRYGNIIACT